MSEQAAQVVTVSHLMLSEEIQTQKQTYYDPIHTKYKNRQNLSMQLEIRIAVSFSKDITRSIYLVLVIIGF